MKLLEDFAIGVVANAIGAPKKVVAEGIADYDAGNPHLIVGFDPITFIAFIEALMAAISGIFDKCPQNNAKLRESVKNPSRGQKVLAIRELRKECDDCSGFRWRRQTQRVVDEVFVQAKAMSDDELDKAIAETRSASFE